MRNRIKALIIALAMCISPLPVWGEEEYVRCEQATQTAIRVYGQTPTAQRDEMITVDAYAKDKSQDNLDAFANSVFSDTIIYHDQLVSGENGVFEVTIGGLSDSGKYTVYVGFANGTVEKNEIYYLNKTDFETMIDDLNGAEKSDEITQLLTIYKNYGIFDFRFIEVDIPSTAEFLIQNLKTNPFSKENVMINADIFKKCAVCAALNNSVVKNVFDYSAEVELDTGLLKDWYLKPYVTESVQKKVTEKLSGKSISSCTAFDEKMLEAFITAVIISPDGIDNACELLSAFYDKIGVEKSEITQTAVSKICGIDHGSLLGIRDAIKRAQEPTGGGNGGGGNGGGKVSTVSETKTAENVPQKINVDIYDDIGSVPWAREAIVALTEKSILSGRGNGKFCPDDNITREEFTKLIVAVFADKQEAAEISFYDVPKNVWFYDYIAKAYAAGLIGGYSSEQFGAGSPITREDMAQIAFKAKQFSGYKFEVNEDKMLQFKDRSAISPYALEAVESLYYNKVINGVSESEFGPKLFATRAQAAKIIHTLLLL